MSPLRRTLATLPLLLSTAAGADEILGLHFGINAWQSHLQGPLHSPDTEEEGSETLIPGTRASLFEFGLSEAALLAFDGGLRHRLPFAPQLRFSRQALDVRGSTRAVTDFMFFDNTYAPDTPIQTRIDMSYDQFTLYYGWGKGRWQFQPGLAQRRYRGSFALAQAAVEAPDGGESSEAIEDVHAIRKRVDMGYLEVTAAIPETPLQVIYASTRDLHSGLKHSERELGLRTHFSGTYLDHYITLSYRKLKIDDNDWADTRANVKVAGLQLRWEFAF